MSSGVSDQEGHEGVGLFIIGGEEADAVMDQVRERNQPGLRIEDRGVYWAIQAPGRIDVDLEDLSERVGRDIGVPEFLVFMATYYGRVVIGEKTFSVVTEMLTND